MISLITYDHDPKRSHKDFSILALKKKMHNEFFSNASLVAFRESVPLHA